LLTSCFRLDVIVTFVVEGTGTRLAGLVPTFESPLGIGGFLTTLSRLGLDNAMIAGSLLSSRAEK
jgi:hypothetical protein